MMWVKDPDAVLDFAVNWAAWLDEDTITASEWIWVGTDDELTIDSDTFTDTAATIWLSGGEAGTTYKLTNRITTSGGRTDDRTRSVKVAER